MLRSIEWLGMFADRRLHTRKEVCKALASHGHLLRPLQADRLRAWCDEVPPST